VLSSVLFGVSPLDPVALLGAALVVAGVAFAAGALPARRAARVDPSRTLHYE
jgi:ABC-type antimicrobial peptide transport system permease subunit